MKTWLIAQSCTNALVALGLVIKVKHTFTVTQKLLTILDQAKNFGIELARSQVSHFFGSAHKFDFRKYLLYEYESHTKNPEDYIIVLDEGDLFLGCIRLEPEQSAFIDCLLTTNQTLNKNFKLTQRRIFYGQKEW